VLDDHQRYVAWQFKQAIQCSLPLSTGKAGHGFIEKQRGRRCCQRKLELEDPLFAMSERGNPPIGEVGETRRLEPSLHLVTNRWFSCRPEPPAASDARPDREGDILGDRQLTKEGRALEGAAQP
jgi:hypothetical protein